MRLSILTSSEDQKQIQTETQEVGYLSSNWSRTAQMLVTSVSPGIAANS
jgi:hypothetical protein